MVEDFRRRFFISIGLTLPILALSPMLQELVGLSALLSFPSDAWVQLALGTAVFFYGGWPFLSGLVSELRDREPGMMTLIGLAIGVAWIYSAAVVIGLTGRVF